MESKLDGSTDALNNACKKRYKERLDKMTTQKKTPKHTPHGAQLKGSTRTCSKCGKTGHFKKTCGRKSKRKRGSVKVPKVPPESIPEISPEEAVDLAGSKEGAEMVTAAHENLLDEYLAPPEGVEISKIDTPHSPTPEDLQHQLNAAWYEYSKTEGEAYSVYAEARHNALQKFRAKLRELE